MTAGALYYPYMQIRDVNWLKATLLVFESVSRILPFDYDDSTESYLKEFSFQDEERPALISGVNLFSERCQAAQSMLAARLRKDAESPEFLQKYSLSGSEFNKQHNPFGFQLHQGKLSKALKEVLFELGLAWDPKVPKPHDIDQQYVAMNETLGQCVMATIAVACSTSEDLSIVGDARSGKLHRCLIEKDSARMYEELVHGVDALLLPDPKEATSREVFEFLVRFRCDVSGLDAKAIRSLSDDREAIDKLLRALKASAQNIGKLDPGEQRDQAFRDEINEVIKNWHSDRASMSKFWKNFFGADLADEGVGFASGVVEKVVEGATTSKPTLVLGATGLAVDPTLSAGLVGAGAGLAVSLVSHTVKSASKTLSAEKNSSYKFLTDLDAAGISFLSDFKPV